MPVPRSALVSGVTGFIGATLARRLMDEGLRVYGLVRAGSRQLSRLEGLPRLEVVEVNTFARDELGRALAGVRADLVFNLAAAGVQPGERDPNDLLAGNAGLLLNLLQAVAAWPVARFLHTGSCSEYGPVEPGDRLRESSPVEPTSLYGAAKLAAWHCGRAVARQLGVLFRTVRLFGCYGPGEAPQRLVPYAIRKLVGNEPVDLTPGDQVRDFLHVEDVAAALWTAAVANGPPGGEVFNVCSGQPTSVRTLVGLLAELLGRPASLLRWGVRPARADEPRWIVGESGAFRHATGWAPRLCLRTGLEQTARDLLGTKPTEGAARAA